MIIKKFVASTQRDALIQLKDNLGDNAVILSNRTLPGGNVEIMAIAEEDMSVLTGVEINDGDNAALDYAKELKKATARQTPTLDKNLSSEEYIRPNPATLAQLTQAAQDQIKKYQQEQKKQQESPSDDNATPPPQRTVTRTNGTISPTTNKQSVTGKPAQRVHSNIGQAGTNSDPLEEIAKEVRILRSMVEGQLAGLAWSDMQRRDPIKLEVMRHLLAVGHGPLLSRQLVAAMPTGLDMLKGMRWIKNVLAKNLKTVTAADELVEKGGIYALVGPTGIGKTTTIAKLAARYTLKHGAYNLALLTTDSYRIGAHDQLRIYGRILGVPVYTVRDDADLEVTLKELQNKHLILIDTVGMSQRDERVEEQKSFLCASHIPVKRILLLNATVQGPTLEDIIRAHQGDSLEGCILTKMDESLNIASALDVIIRHRLALHYVTNGQRVPEDLHLANALYLTDRSLRLVQDESGFSLGEAEYPLVMSHLMAEANHQISRQNISGEIPKQGDEDA